MPNVWWGCRCCCPTYCNIHESLSLWRSHFLLMIDRSVGLCWGWIRTLQFLWSVIVLLGCEISASGISILVVCAFLVLVMLLVLAYNHLLHSITYFSSLSTIVKRICASMSARLNIAWARFTTLMVMVVMMVMVVSSWYAYCGRCRSDSPTSGCLRCVICGLGYYNWCATVQSANELLNFFLLLHITSMIVRWISSSTCSSSGRWCIVSLQRRRDIIIWMVHDKIPRRCHMRGHLLT